MSESIAKIRDRIKFLKDKNPAHKKMLDFYEKIREKQEDYKPGPDVSPIGTSDNFRTLQIKEGFPLINKEDFILDIMSSVELFKSLCEVGKNATDKMKENLVLIEDAVRNRALDIEKLLTRYYDEAYLKNVLRDTEVDESVLKFLVHMSIKPSIKVNVEKLKDKVDMRNWLRGYCPVCGSFPHMSELKGEGQRFFECSFCGFEWPSERLKCPFCENKDHESLHFFCEEGKEVYRVDVCDKCKQYIKTVDSRKLNFEPDLELEDIATIHLDMMASEKGFKRPVPSPWG